jgi:hypothetical protein
MQQRTEMRKQREENGSRELDRSKKQGYGEKEESGTRKKQRLK